MVNDKNHLYSKEDYQKDLKDINKIKASQGFSRFSTAAATSLNDAGLTQVPEAMQLDTRNSWFREINDTFGSVGLQTIDVFFGTDPSGDRNNVTYNIYTVTDDITFAFSGTPYGKMLPFTLDLTINKAVNPPEPVITWPASLVNAPNLTGLLTNGTRIVLHFETVRDATSERQVFIGGNSNFGGGGGSQTPWLSDIDAAGFKLFGFKQLEFNNQFVITDPTLAQLGADPTGDMVGNVASGDNFQQRINDVEITRTGLESSVATYQLTKGLAAATGLATRVSFVANNTTPALVIFAAIDMEVQNTTPTSEEGSMHNLVRDQGSLATYVSYNDNQLHEIHTFKDIVMSVLTNLTIDQGALFFNSAENMSIQEVGTTIMEFNSNAGISSSIQFKAENDLVLNINKTSAQFTSPAIAVSMGQLGLEGRDPAPIFLVDGFFWHNDVTGPLKGHVFVRTAGQNVDLATIVTNPMTAELDAGTFDIFNLDRLTFFSGTSLSATLEIGLSKAASDVLRINTISGGDVTITEEEVVRFRFDGTLNEVQAVDSILAVLRTAGPTKYQMVMASDRIILDHPTKQQWQIGSLTQMELTPGALDFIVPMVISNVDQIGFTTLGNIIQDTATTMQYDVVPGGNHLFRDGTLVFMDLDTDKAIYQEFYFQWISRTSPGVTGAANVGRLFMDSANAHHVSVIRNGAVIDLEAGSSPLTTKGDIFVFDTADTRLPIGANTFVLTADSATGIGMKWAAPATGGEDFVDKIRCVMEVPEGSVAYPDYQLLTAQGMHISGMVMPDGTATSTINLKVEIPQDLAASPTPTLIVRMMSLGAGTTEDIRLLVESLPIGNSENIDVAFTAQTEATVAVPDTINNRFTYTQTITPAISVGDTLFIQITRDPTDVLDDYEADILIYDVFLQINRTAT